MSAMLYKIVNCAYHVNTSDDRRSYTLSPKVLGTTYLLCVLWLDPFRMMGVKMFQKAILDYVHRLPPLGDDSMYELSIQTR